MSPVRFGPHSAFSQTGTGRQKVYAGRGKAVKPSPCGGQLLLPEWLLSAPPCTAPSCHGNIRDTGRTRQAYIVGITYAWG